MKQSTLFTIAAVAAGLLFIRKKRSASGVGGINPYIAISKLQDAGVNLSIPYDQMSDKMKSRIYTVANQFGYKQTARSMQTYTYEEAFLKSLMPTYNKAVAGIGDPETDDYTAYNIQNANGETMMVYHDVNDFPMIHTVMNEWDLGSEGQVRTADEAYLSTICYIANGGKFIWQSVKSECFATRGNAAGERRSRISILAGKDKGGVSIDQLAERFTSLTGADMEARNGIIQAIIDCETAKDAKAAIKTEALRRVDANREQNGFNVNYDDIPF